MKKKLFTIVAIMAISHLSFSQTKRIMHRSHSGSDASLPMDESDDSFGLPSGMKELMKKSDSTTQAQKQSDSLKAAKSSKKTGSDSSKAAPKVIKPKKKTTK